MPSQDFTDKLRRLGNEAGIGLLMNGDPSFSVASLPTQNVQPAQRRQTPYTDPSVSKMRLVKGMAEAYGVIPDYLAKGLPIKIPEPTYIGNAEKLIGDDVKDAMEEITYHYRRTDGAIPYHWGNLKVAVADLGGWYVNTTDGKKKVAGTKGLYVPDEKLMVIDSYLVNGEFMDLDHLLKTGEVRYEGKKDLKKTITHEEFHSVQDATGTIDRIFNQFKGNESYAVSMIEANADRESGTNSYLPEQEMYLKQYGDVDITSFSSNLRQYKDCAANYSSSLSAAPAFGPVNISF